MPDDNDQEQQHLINTAGLTRWERFRIGCGSEATSCYHHTPEVCVMGMGVGMLLGGIAGGLVVGPFLGSNLIPPGLIGCGAGGGAGALTTGCTTFWGNIRRQEERTNNTTAQTSSYSTQGPMSAPSTTG